MLETETKQWLEWPTSSPSLPLIEHAWDILGRRITARLIPPLTVCNLEIPLLEEGNENFRSLTDNLIASRKNRCAIVLAIWGYHNYIKYHSPSLTEFFYYLQVYKFVFWRITLYAWDHFKELKFPYMMFWCLDFCITL